MKSRKTEKRNREIFAAYRRGMTPFELAAHYRLTRASIVAIISVEQHRLEVSEDAFYRQLRMSLGIESFLAAEAAK